MHTCTQNTSCSRSKLAGKPACPTMRKEGGRVNTECAAQADQPSEAPKAMATTEGVQRSDPCSRHVSLGRLGKAGHGDRGCESGVKCSSEHGMFEILAKNPRPREYAK